MQLSNFNLYKEGTNDVKKDGFINYQGLNMLTTVFSVMFSIFNALLMGFVFESKFQKNILISLIFGLQLSVLLYTNFIFSDMSFHSIISLTIAIVFTLILIPAFGYIINAI